MGVGGSLDSKETGHAGVAQAYVQDTYDVKRDLPISNWHSREGTTTKSWKDNLLYGGLRAALASIFEDERIKYVLLPIN